MSGGKKEVSDAEVSARNPLKTALGALVGLRKREDFERDAAHLKPQQLIVVALALVVMFVGGIVSIVFFVLH